MGVKHFSVQDSTLSPEAIADVLLARYYLPGRVQCRFWRKGICDTYQVEAGEDDYYLKVYRADRRTRMDVAEEVRLLNHLADHGISVARPVMRRDGLFVNRVSAPEGTRYSVLFESARGVKGDDADPDRGRAYGEMVARVHQRADTLPGPYRRDRLDMRHLVGDNVPAIARLMAHRRRDLSLIVEIADECRARIAKLLPRSKPEYGICIGDLHGGDVRDDGEGRPTLFDFESSGGGWRALDVGVCLASDDWMNVSDDAEYRRQLKLRAFLEGYSRIRKLGENELQAVQLGPPVRHIYLMGIVLRYTAKCEGLQWADDHFIDWHMTWFQHWAGEDINEQGSV